MGRGCRVCSLLSVQPWPVTGIQRVLTEHSERMEGPVQAPSALEPFLTIPVSVTCFLLRTVWLLPFPLAWHCPSFHQGALCLHRRDIVETHQFNGTNSPSLYL